MQVMMENIKVLAPFMLIAWGFLIVCTLQKPQRYFNSILLMIAVFFTLMFLVGLFGEYMGYALLGMFLLVVGCLFLVPVILVANGIVMLRKESVSFAHILSLLLGLVIGVGEIAAVCMVLGAADLEFFNRIDRYAFFVAMT